MPANFVVNWITQIIRLWLVSDTLLGASVSTYLIDEKRKSCIGH